MASAFELAWQNDALPEITASDLAQAVIYRQPFVADRTIYGVLLRAEPKANIYGTLYVRVADFASTPAEGNFAIIDGKVYRVVEVEPERAGATRLYLRLDTREPVAAS